MGPSPFMRLLYRLGEIQDHRRWVKKQKSDDTIYTKSDGTQYQLKGENGPELISLRDPGGILYPGLQRVHKVQREPNQDE